MQVTRRLEVRCRERAVGRMSTGARVPRGDVKRWAAEPAATQRVTASVPVEAVDAVSSLVLSAAVRYAAQRQSTVYGQIEFERFD